MLLSIINKLFYLNLPSCQLTPLLCHHPYVPRILFPPPHPTPPLFPTPPLPLPWRPLVARFWGMTHIQCSLHFKMYRWRESRRKGYKTHTRMNDICTYICIWWQPSLKGVLGKKYNNLLLHPSMISCKGKFWALSGGKGKTFLAPPVLYFRGAVYFPEMPNAVFTPPPLLREGFCLNNACCRVFIKK